MASEEKGVELLQGTLDLIVLRSLSTMGALHAYALATRLAQVSDHPLSLNQGTLYPALVRLERRRGGATLRARRRAFFLRQSHTWHLWGNQRYPGHPYASRLSVANADAAFDHVLEQLARMFERHPERSEQ